MTHRKSVVVPGSAWERFLYRSDFLRGAAVVDGHDVSLRSFASMVEELKAAVAPAPSSLVGGEKAVMVCPQCEGEGEYADGVDEAACSTPCTRCDGNGWLVDLAALSPEARDADD